MGTSLAPSGFGMRLLGYLNCEKSGYQYHSLLKLNNSGHYNLSRNSGNKITDTAQSINNWAVSNSSSMVVII